MAEQTNKPKPAAFTAKTTKQKYIHLGIAIAILLIIMHLPAPASLEEGTKSMRLLGIITAVVYLWITEALPHAVSACLIIILIPLLKVGNFGAIFAGTFGTTTFAFFMGVFTLSAVCKKSGFSKRLGSLFMLYSSSNSKVLLLGSMIISFIFSMFITDMAAVAMVLPIVIAILTAMNAIPKQSNYGKCLTLGVSWGAIYGGICTPAGVGSNITTMKLLTDLAGMEVSFIQWMKLCVPIGIVGLLVGFFVLQLCFKPEVNNIDIDKEALKKELQDEPMTFGQKYALALFILVVLAYIFSDKLGLGVALISFMIIPAAMLPGVGIFKGWDELQKSINWGAIILAVCGVIVGTLANDFGLAQWITGVVLKPLASLPGALQIYSITLITDIVGILLSSMTITASVCVPLAITFSQTTGAPVWATAIAACCASSTVMVLVTQTPTLIISYAEGYYTLKDCAKAGIIMTFVSALIVTLVVIACGMPAVPF
ncbi:SLC13 family permease [Lachnospiraceae bacterium 62-35]